MRYIVMTGLTNNRLRAKAVAQSVRALTAHKRKSAAAKRMDRPHRLDLASNGYFKIEGFLSRGVQKLRKS